jgi:dienelactone hydrolase
MTETLESLISDSNILVQMNPWLVFSPVGENLSTGLILYPGGLVDPVAYAPAGREIAKAGYLVIIPPMPLNLVVFDFSVAADIMDTYPETSNWGIGGHSLGGSMAAKNADQNPGDISGLVLWVSYLAKTNDPSDDLIVVSGIFGTQNGVATREEVLESRSQLPVDTVWVPIEGGNHS